MRRAAASLLFSFLVASAAPESAQRVDRIELRLSGWASLDVEVNSGGEGHYLLTDYPHRRTGAFRLTAQQYEGLVARLTAYRQQAVPMNDSSMRELMRWHCPEGTPDITDQGAIWVHWIAPGVNEHYIADLGCDAQRNADRNEDLLSILRALPVPLDP